MINTAKRQRKYHSPVREQQAGQTRERILDAARRLILNKGFADSTIEAIASEAGVAAPTVYAAFGSKRGIVQGLMERAAFSSGYGELVREAMRSDDPETRVRYAARIARRIFDSLRSGAAKLVGVLAGESPARGTCPVAPVVISGGGEGDQSARSPEVKVLVGWVKTRSAPTGGQANRQVVAKANGREAPKLRVLT